MEETTTLSQFDKNWTKPSIKIGIITVVCAMLASFLPNIYLYVAYGAAPTLSVALSAWASIAMIYGAFYIVEPMSYYPIFGLTGTYMGILSGNIANVRLPASAVAQEAVGVENGSEKGQIISALAIAGSIITNLFFLTIAVILGTQILKILPEPFRIAFQQYTMPAIFGALYGQFTIHKPKIALFAMPVCIAMLLFTKSPPWVLILVAIFGNVAIARLLYKAKIID